MSQKTDKPKHLGRGLASLLGPIKSSGESKTAPVPIMPISSNSLSDNDIRSNLRDISVKDIQPNPQQVRSVWNDSVQSVSQLMKDE